jgi:hypothetical protein
MVPNSVLKVLASAVRFSCYLGLVAVLLVLALFDPTHKEGAQKQDALLKPLLEFLAVVIILAVVSVVVSKPSQKELRWIRYIVLLLCLPLFVYLMHVYG